MVFPNGLAGVNYAGAARSVLGWFSKPRRPSSGRPVVAVVAPVASQPRIDVEGQ
jgi:hypothetical protein